MALAQTVEARFVVKAPGSVPSASEQFDVEVAIEDVENLGGFEFILNFDPAVLEAVSAVGTDFLASSGREVLCVNPEVAEAAIRVECLTLGPTPAEGVDGDGTVAVVTMRSKHEGSPPLKLTRVKLLQPDGTNIPVSWEDASVSTTGGRDWLPFAIVGGIVAALLIIGGGGLALGFRRRSTTPPATPAPVDSTSSTGQQES
jgi:hypothetical protein